MAKPRFEILDDLGATIPEPQTEPQPQTSPPADATERGLDAEIADSSYAQFASAASKLTRRAEAFAIHDADEPMHIARCFRCNAEMWTWSEKENVCERCAYEIRVERQAAVKKANQKRAPVSFGEGNGAGRVPVNVDGGKATRQVNPYTPTPDKSARINPLGDAPVRKSGGNPFGK